MRILRFGVLVLAFLAVAVPAGAISPGERYIVKVKELVVRPNASSPGSIETMVSTLGGQVQNDWMDELVVAIPEAAAAALRAHPAVKYLQRVVSGPFVPHEGSIGETRKVSPNHVPTPNDVLPPWSSGIYSYDGAGNISKIGADKYVYDPMSRLVQSNVSGHAEAYSYDAFGNLISRTTDGQTTPFATNLQTNHLLSETYDAPGNDDGALDQSQQFWYDPVNMMRKKYVSITNMRTFFIYTASDERLGTIACPPNTCNNSNNVYYYWTFSLRDEAGKVLRQYKGIYDSMAAPWTWIEDYVYRNDLLLAADRESAEGGRRQFHLDHLGTPRLVTGDAGQKIARHDYFPFGAEINPPGLLQETASGFDREEPMKFTGHERDFNRGTAIENTNYNDSMHARQMVAATGRFLSVDPELPFETALH